jgi:hypothetical protein
MFCVNPTRRVVTVRCDQETLVFLNATFQSFPCASSTRKDAASASHPAVMPVIVVL